MTLHPGQRIRFLIPLDEPRECEGVIRRVIGDLLVVGPTMKLGGEWFVRPEQVTWAEEPKEERR